MLELGIDIETYSETDIKCGVHKYAEDKNFEITLFAYSVDKQKPKLIDLACKEKIPNEIIIALSNPNVLKTAYNAAFEITCLSKFIGFQLDPNQWSCTQALAAQAGLPFGLDNVAKVLSTVQQKDKNGKELIKFFTMPCKPTKTNGERTRNYPGHDFDKWMEFREYCCQDVATEQNIREQLKWFKISDFEKDIWALDQKINNTGVEIDLELVQNAIKIEAIVSDKLINEMIKMTGINNPKSNAQIKKLIQEMTGSEISSLNKENMPEVFKAFKDNKDVVHVLKIREKLSRTSIRKFTAMANSVCLDNKIRGLFMYYGANRTGRWAGRNVQLQNLKRNDLDDLDFARRLVKENNLDALELSYDDVGRVLSNLIRTAFIGDELIVSDFSAIEARVVAWLADEKWRLEVFSTHGKIYEASASQMFKIPLDAVTKPIRTKGKISELALGYQGGPNALMRMEIAVGTPVADRMPEAELPKLVKQWRNANKKIVKFWYDMQDAVVEAITNGHATMQYGLDFSMREKCLIIKLPSGRELVYRNARFEPIAGKDTITYFGMDQITSRWVKLVTYGGKLVENIVQAVARDVLADAMVRVDKAGYNITMHVHDEIVINSKKDVTKEINNILSSPISWAKGLPLGAETFKAKYYQK
jgi:DNA polymerase bacteriophage-type